MPQVSPFLLTRQEDKAAYDWIQLELTRQHGRGEAVYTYDNGSGKLIAQWHSAMMGADIHPTLAAAMRSGVSAVLHHNHPSSGSFIQTDLLTLIGLNPHHQGLPTMAEMWAHGKVGTRYRISLTHIGHAAAVCAAVAFLARKRAIWQTSSGGHEIFADGWEHLVCLCLEDKGYVSYEYNVTNLPNYQTRSYPFRWNGMGATLTIERAYPEATRLIIQKYGHLL